MLRKILVAEDNELNRAALKAMLCREYDVIEARDGKEAILLLHRKHKLISAVLLDIAMPVMDGYEVLSQMRGNAVLSQIPVIVATGSAEAGAEVKALSLGANDFITKPYDPALILHSLRNVISLRETASIVNAIQRDKLTGLYNREAFFDKASAMLAEQAPGTFLMSCFDIDSFKLINEQYGAAGGDRILSHIGRVVRGNIGAIGGIGGRISADNFALLYPAGKEETDFVTNLRENSFVPPDTPAAVSFSVGRYVVTDLSLPASAIYDRAYMAKQSVKGRYDRHIAYFSESMREKLIQEQKIVGEMDAALMLKQFEVWFQPKVNHATGALIGAEALARWRHPEKGLIPPDQFIEVFEQTGFIYELDKYVWQQTCYFLRKWIDMGLEPCPVSVNISRYDLFRTDMIDVITGIIEDYRIPVDLLRLEITESAFAKSSEPIIDAVKRLMNYGLTMEIDDFGSGYSSLNTLKDVPANALKLDMRFLDNKADAQRGGNILESIVRMARWLGMSVIAEGVETKEQADFLKSIGCNHVQGYLYAKPMPPETYETLMKNALREEPVPVLETIANLDSNAFWDPASIDTLIFNSYIGGACVFEYRNGAAELLRVNDKFTQVIGSASMTIDDVLRLRWEAHLDGANRAAMAEALRRSIETGDEVSGEFVFLNLPGCPERTHLRTSLRVIASFGDRHLVYCTTENTTAYRAAEARERVVSAQLKAIMEDVSSGITATTLENGEIHFLIANDKYYETLGYTQQQYEAEVQDVYGNIHEEDRACVREISETAYREEASAQIEYRILRRDGSERIVRAVLTPTRFAGMELAVQLGVFTDITAERNAENTLYETDAQLKFLNEAAHDLLAQPDSDRGIELALQKLLAYFDGNRAYVFEFDYINSVSNNTYEICAAGVTSEKERLQNVPMEIMAFWLHAFDRQNNVNITDVDALDDSRREEREVLSAQGIKSLIAVPLNRDGVLIGFIGIDDPQKKQAQVSRLVALGDFLAVMLTRRDLDAKIRSDNETLLRLMNDTPGGFVRMRVRPDGTAVPVYFNDGFCKLVGMSQKALMDLYEKSAMAGVHPDDLAIVQDAVNCMLKTGEARSAKYRLQHGAGGYVYVMFFGRMTKNDAGETFFNIYYTDVSEQQKIEEKREELLENLPCGAGIYEISGGKMRATYLNRRYRAYLNREIADLSEAPVFEVVHPDDRKRLQEALQAALAQGGEGTCDIRIMDGKGGYLPFRLVGSAMGRSSGKNAIYVTFTPITKEELSYSEMLPVALAAVIGASPDLTFVKDRNFRYVCCSRAFAQAAGLSNESEIVGKTDYDLLDKAYADSYRAGEETLIKSGAAHLDYEEIMPTFDGSVRYASTSKYPLLDASGNVIGIYGISRDITRARETDSQLELLTDSIPGGLATYACAPGDVKVLYFNDGFCDLFGFTREALETEMRSDPAGMVFDEDRPELDAQLDRLIRDNTPIDLIYRAHTKDGGTKWISHKAAAAGRRDDTVIVNAVLLDVTEQQETTERLRISEEEHRLAIRHSGTIICRFSVADRTVTMSPETAAAHSFPETLTNVPEGPIQKGQISPDTAGAYTAFYESILRGEQTGSAVFQKMSKHGWRWFEAHFSTIFSDSGKPVSAVISYYDVTERLEKETVYKKWQQSLSEKAPESYTLFRCNLSKDASFDTMEGSLLTVDFSKSGLSFNERTAEYADQFVFEEDQAHYLALLDSDTLLANYYRGKRAQALEYREKREDGGLRWLRLSIDLVEYPNSSDVEAYLMYENIDDSKKAELLTIERAETDPLTGLLNRLTFSTRVNHLIQASKPGIRHALLMLDVDGFKQVNDVFGHGAGDEVLIGIAGSLRTALRRGDLLCRLGGDEFLVFLNDIPSDVIAMNKARQICALVRKSFSVEVQISGSIGIASCPRDGADFETLYKKVDAALYYVKGSGKDNFAFYQPDMDGEHLALERRTAVPAATERQAKMRRMLIVDDSQIDHELLSNIFKDEFIIEKAMDGNTALIRLRHYGSAISVVLLDLLMPGMDGFAVLEKMQSNQEMQAIPVIVVSGDEARETSLRAIKSGATDFVNKPVDADLLRIRVQSAISKAENERLRAKNSFLELQNDELAKYRTVFEHTATVLIEHDWVKGTFSYDPSVAAAVAGIWDSRKLWQILLSDKVAGATAVKDMQALVHSVAEDRKRSEGTLLVKLKTPAGELHRFRMNVYKRTDEYQLTDKLVITLTDTEGPPSAAKEDAPKTPRRD